MLNQQIDNLLPEPTELELQGLSEGNKNNIKGLTRVLNEETIDLRKLRAYLSNGIPDQANTLREASWKVILGYLPRCRARWQDQDSKQQKHYLDFIEHYLPASRFENYPLIMNKQHPQWKDYEQDFYLWEQIEKDTSRTQSELAFFSTEVDPILIPFVTPARKEKWKMINGEEEDVMKGWLKQSEQRRTYRYDYMTRILFIFAKVNPRAQYVQGMNEVLAPIFYLINHRKKGAVQEAAAFFMFNNVMSDLLELNIEDFDKRENGIHARMREVDRIMLVAEPHLWQQLNALKVDQVYYCFRWLTLLFAQDFHLFETLRIWEAIFSCEDRALYVNCFAVALLVALRQQIMGGTYGSVLTAIKSLREKVNLAQVIFRAFELYQELRGCDINSMAQLNLSKLQRKELKKSKSHKPRILMKIMKKLL